MTSLHTQNREKGERVKASPKTIKIIVKMTYAVSALGSVFMIAIGDYWGAFALAFIGLSVYYSFDRTDK